MRIRAGRSGPKARCWCDEQSRRTANGPLTRFSINCVILEHRPIEFPIMNMYHTDAYRAAFIAYLRKGTPIRLLLKETGATGQYVWRTQHDERVRTSHRVNDGRIFSWSDPPPSGHPGEDYICRCEAVPYISGETEFTFTNFPRGWLRVLIDGQTPTS